MTNSTFKVQLKCLERHKTLPGFSLLGLDVELQDVQGVTLFQKLHHLTNINSITSNGKPSSNKSIKLNILEEGENSCHILTNVQFKSDNVLLDETIWIQKFQSPIETRYFFIQFF